MKTKAEILGRLLKERHIDEEELVILLIAEKQIQFVPYSVPYYPIPYSWPPHPWLSGPVWSNKVNCTVNGPITVPTFTSTN